MLDTSIFMYYILISRLSLTLIVSVSSFYLDIPNSNLLVILIDITLRVYWRAFQKYKTISKQTLYSKTTYLNVYIEEVENICASGHFEWPLKANHIGVKVHNLGINNSCWQLNWFNLAIKNENPHLPVWNVGCGLLKPICIRCLQNKHSRRNDPTTVKFTTWTLP